jgi:hypothetical protein
MRKSFTKMMTFFSFIQWVTVIEEFSVPTQIINLINPVRGRLRYPIDKPRNAGNVKIMCDSERNVDAFWDNIDNCYEVRTHIAQHEAIEQCLIQGGPMQRTPAWLAPDIVKDPTQEPDYRPFSKSIHDVSLQYTGNFDKLAICDTVKQKSRSIPGARAMSTALQHHTVDTDQDDNTATQIVVDKRTHRVFKSIFHVPSSELGDITRAVKWDEFKRAMVRVGFTAEKLQGYAWQFMPTSSTNAERGIQFHEPHPNSDVPFILARRFGRRLERVYGWSSGMFKLA